MTELNIAQRSFLLEAIACLLAVSAEAERGACTGNYQASTTFCQEELALLDAQVALPEAFEVAHLSSQDGHELMDLIRSGPVAVGGVIINYYSEEPDGYAGQVPADADVWKVPATLTIAGAETADEAAQFADELLSRALLDGTVNADEHLLQYQVVGYESAMPGTVEDLTLAGDWPLV